MSTIRCLPRGFGLAFFVAAACWRSTHGVGLLGSLKQADAEAGDNARPAAQGDPFLVTLRRESVPVYRHGKIASFKTSYSGMVSVGAPASQRFHMVMDTGSAHVLLPSAKCKSQTCMAHQRYDMNASSTSVYRNLDGSTVAAGKRGDRVTIGFGTGEVLGEFAHDKVCLHKRSMEHEEESPNRTEEEKNDAELCVQVNIVSALQMSDQPFRTFGFDGILGLGLQAMALSSEFSFFDALCRTRQLAPQFAFFLTDGEDGEESELALGGYNEQRLLAPLAWTPVALRELGYWLVSIEAVRVAGKTLDVCMDGTCKGVVDTGTSHLGMPRPLAQEMSEQLATDAGNLLDCRLAQAPALEIELTGGARLHIPPATYMRRLPLREGVSVSSQAGVTMEAIGTKREGTKPSPTAAADASASAAASGDSLVALSVNLTLARGGAATPAAVPKGTSPEPNASAGQTDVSPSPWSQAGDEGPSEEVKRYCRPRFLPVQLPAPMGPKLFILGEPVLHSHYAVFDWEQQRIGFGLAANRVNTMDAATVAKAGDRGKLPDGIDMLLLQQDMQVDSDLAVHIQVTVLVRPAALAAC